MNRDKVIRGLECCMIPGVGGCDECPYVAKGMCQELLGENAIALLKAQEPVEPIENAGFYYCGACRYAFTSARQKYCSECGRAVKWDE